MFELGSPSPSTPANGPRVSPKLATETAQRADYFVPPTPGAGGSDHPPGWSPFLPAPGPPRRTGGSDNHAAAGAYFGGAGGEPSVAIEAGCSGGVHASGSNAGQADGENPWHTSAPSSFILSPSSSAFNAKFNHLLRSPQTATPTGTGGGRGDAVPATPLHAPAASPFFPSGSTSSPASQNAPIPPTPGPGISSSFQPPSGLAPKFNFPTTFPFAGRKAPLPSTRPGRTAAPSSAAYTLILPQTLLSLLDSSLSSPAPSSPPLLLLDIRTHTSYLAERLATAINVCVPSTLLRRPGFGIDRVQEGLPPDEQDVFASWASCENIVVIDAESTSLSEGAVGVASLLAKFEKAGFKGKLGWIKGGWYAVKTQAKSLSQEQKQKLFEVGATAPSVPSSAQPSPTLTGLATSPSASTSTTAITAPPSTSKKHGRPVLQVRDLPVAAFQLASTSAFVHSDVTTPRNGINLSVISPSSSEGSSSSRRPNMGKRRKSGNEPTGGGTSLAAALGAGSPTPGREMLSGSAVDAGWLKGSGSGKGQMPQGGPAEAHKRMSTNPFFDNIRQNSEALSLERSLAHLSPVDLPHVSPALIPLLPPFLQSLIALTPLQRADKLARQFYELEVAERERLEGTFRWHAQHTALEQAAHSGTEADRRRFDEGEESPEGRRWKRFGISAGVELGNLNRFKNIFPYEHCRVRLALHSPSATDYVNASHLYLPPSSKRFIASQGPLPTTFRDFWQMCDQEHVGVIIMLTNLHEGGREKCGRYWVSPPGGKAEWEVSVEGDAAHEEEERQRQREQSGGAFGAGSGGGFFAAADFQNSVDGAPAAASPQDTTVRRIFNVRRVAGPSAASSSSSRKIRHIQYRAWPDFDIPANPADVISLVHEVDAAQTEYMREIGWDMAEHGGAEPPILAHCSAGVGRTGVFIMVSSLLDKLRREREADRECQRRGAAQKDDEKMDIDSTAPASVRPVLPQRTSDPETSSLSAHFSLSSLDSSSSPSSANSPTPSSTEPPSSSSSEPSSAPSLSTRSSCSSLRATAAVVDTPSGPHPVLPDVDDPTPALLHADPVFAGVNELREQRMSMIANYRQYVCVLECVLEGVAREIKDEGARA
ncbi:hypothetical protein JCM1841_002826 [Sporobolomyces salmonicolor]